MLDPLVEAIVDMREDEAVSMARDLLEKGADPLGMLEACRGALEKVGERFAAGTYFIPELILAAEMLTQISETARARIAPGGAGHPKKLGKLVLGTVQGDIHDIGKNIVAFVMEMNGFEVIDLGIDVPLERFVEAVRTHEPEILGLSGLLTLAYEPMKRIVQALGEAGLRDRVKVMIGGGAMSEEVRSYTRADAYGKDPVVAVSLAKTWMSEVGHA